MFFYEIVEVVQIYFAIVFCSLLGVIFFLSLKLTEIFHLCINFFFFGDISWKLVEINRFDLKLVVDDELTTAG